MSQATVDWGDGTATEQVPVSGTPASWSFTGKQHTYAASGTFAIKVTGLSGGIGQTQVVLAGAPTLSGTPTTGITVSGTTVTVPKPAGLVNGDYLVALIRGQVASANDIIPPLGWGRIGVNYAPSDAVARCQGFFSKPVVDVTREPANYVFTIPALGRGLGIITILKGVGNTQPGGYYNSYPGLGAVPHKWTDPFTLPTLPALHLFGAGAEHSANAADTLSSTPAGMTLAQSLKSDTVQTNSRTSLYLYTATRNTSPAGVADVIWTATSAACAQSLALRGPVNYYFPDVTAALNKPGFTMAHRGNSVTYAEMSKDAYVQSDRRGYAMLEFSVARTSDGVWFGLHDDTLNRTSKTTGLPVVSTMTWAQVQTYQNLMALDLVPQPYYRLDDLLTDFGSTHILVIDPKYVWLAGGALRTEFWNVIAGVPKNHVLIKGYVDTVSLASAATANGYQSWGYGYEADVANPSFPTWAAAWTVLGLNIAAPQASWDTIKAFGKKVIGHIATDRAMYDSAIAKGADGVQVGSTSSVPAVNGTLPSLFWASGASGAGVADGRFGTWLGSTPQIAATWLSDPACYPLVPASSGCPECGEYANWLKPLDIAIASPFTSWVDEAAGTNDAWWTSLATNLAAARAGRETWVRPYYEFNGNWMDWSVPAGQEANFRTAFARTVGILKAQFPAVKIMLGTSATNNGVDVATVWPTVPVDALSIDFYNTYPWVNTQTDFDNKINSGATYGSLEVLRQLAATKGVPVVISEWGNASTTGLPGGGGDAAQFIRSMRGWLLAHSGQGPGQVRAEMYFNVTEGYAENYYLVNEAGVVNPAQTQAAATYRSLW